MTDPLYLKTGNAREQHYFYQNDHLGTPQKLMSTTGAIVWDARYEAFGKATPIPLLPGVQPIDNPLRFAGQYHDPETGWHYNWHRYYAPELGRYITSDPIGLEGGLNTYAYVGGNPLRGMDPSGLSEEILFAIGIGGTGFAAVGKAAVVIASSAAATTATFLSASAAAGVGIGTLMNRGYEWASGGIPLGVHIYDWTHDESLINEVYNESANDDTDSGVQQQVEIGANWAEYHRICDEPEPPGFANHCELWKWRLNKANACRAARQAMTDRWFNGQANQEHVNHMAQIENQIANAQRKVEIHCQKICN
jgi:RHS repeat-associated protein